MRKITYGECRNVIIVLFVTFHFSLQKLEPIYVVNLITYPRKKF